MLADGRCEAPGRDEVLAGEPFVGKCGVLLGSALRSLRVMREDVYITSLVKELPLNAITAPPPA
jgi:uracil-DNA glycosylase family 4